MARLLIGSYIIDAADTSSTSTTSGVKLRLDPDEPLTERITGGDLFTPAGEFRWPIMHCLVTAASESAIETAVTALRDQIRNCAGKTVIYEETNGTTLIQMHANVFPDASAEVEIEQSQTKAIVSFAIIGRQFRPVSGGAAGEPGQASAITWEYEITASGLAGITATAVFGPTLSGTSITAGARENAETWIEKMKASANFPSWMSTAFRFVGANIEFDQKQNLASVTEAAYDPARVTLVYREMYKTLAADGTFPTTIASANCNISMNERPPLNARAGKPPGFDITLYGDFTLKTSGETEFLSNDTSLADGAIYAAAQAGVQSVITMFRSIYSSLALIQWGDPVLNIDPVQGVVGFAVRFTGNTDILEWEESAIIHNQDQVTHSRSSDGAGWRYGQKGGPIRVFHHDLTIVSASSPQPYRRPNLNKNWDRLNGDAHPSIKMSWNNGQAEYHTKYRSTWFYVNPGPGDHGGGQFTNGPFDIDTVGSGVV